MVTWKRFSVILLCVLVLLAGCTARTDGGQNNPQQQTEISKAVEQDKQTPTQTDADVGKGKAGGELRVALAASTPSLDPMFTTTTQTRMFALHIYETLVTWDYNYKVIPQLATGWKIDNDAKTYTFELRKGVLFQNGKEMTSEDVLASFERFRKISPRKQIFDKVEAFQAPDASTFQITFKEPQPTFLQDLAIPLPQVVIMPKEFADVEGGRLRNEQIVGTGPYQLEDYVPDQHLKLKRFDNYTAQKGTPPSGLGGERIAYLDRITFRFVPEKASRLNGLEAGEFDYAESLDASVFDRIQKSDKLKPVTMSPYFKVWAVFNTLKPPFNNVQLRQAVAMGLDQDAVMLAASGNKALYQLNHSLYYPDQFWYSDVGKSNYNQKKKDEAKELIKNSGYNGEEVVINTNKDYDFMYQASVVLQAQLKELGINARLNVLDWPTSSKISTDPKTWDQFNITYTGLSLRFDPTGYNINFHSRYNFWPYKNEELDRLIDEGMKHTDINTRKQSYDQMQELILKDVPIIQHGDVFTLNAATNKLQNDKPWYILRFWNVWME